MAGPIACSLPRCSPLSGTRHAASGCMIYFLLARTFAFLLDLVAIVRRSDQEKDREGLLLRQQLRMLQLKHSPSPRWSPLEQRGLAVLAARLTAVGGRAHAPRDQLVLVVK